MGLIAENIWMLTVHCSTWTGRKSSLFVDLCPSSECPEINPRIAKLSTGYPSSDIQAVAIPTAESLMNPQWGCCINTYYNTFIPFVRGTIQTARGCASLSLPMNFLPPFWGGVPWILHPTWCDVRRPSSALRTVGSGTAWPQHFPLNLQILSLPPQM